MNSKTEDGKDNIILSMPQGTPVVLDSREARTSDGYTWYKVRYIFESIDESGWVVSDFLEMWFFIPLATTTVYEVDYDRNREFDVACPQSEPQRFSQGLVKYKEAGSTSYLYTSLDEWNAAAGPQYQIPRVKKNR